MKKAATILLLFAPLSMRAQYQGNPLHRAATMIYSEENYSLRPNDKYSAPPRSFRTKIKCADCRRAARSFNSNRIYLTFSMGESILFYPKSNGLLQVSFPYSATTKAGTSQHTFGASTTNPFSKPFGAFGLDFQLGSKNHFFDFDFGLGGSMDYFSFGYGRRAKGRESMTNRINIKTSINVGFYEFFVPMGSFDNRGKIIDVLGQRADSTFFTKVGAHGQWKTYNASYVNVQYLQHDFMINPKIAFEYHPLKSLFFIEFSLSYLLPFSEIAKIRLEQTDGGRATLGIDNFSLDTKNLTTTFNGNPITSTPFRFGGLQIGLKLGF